MASLQPTFSTLCLRADTLNRQSTLEVMGFAADFKACAERSTETASIPAQAQRAFGHNVGALVDWLITPEHGMSPLGHLSHGRTRDVSDDLQVRADELARQRKLTSCDWPFS